MSPYDDFGTFYAAAALVFSAVAIVGGVFGYLLWSWFAMKLFQKAGVQGDWRAWVPVYSQMIFLKLGDINPWLFLFNFAWIVPFVGQILGGIASLGVTVLLFMAAYRIGVKLGKDPAFTALFLLAPIWLGIVAFDSSRWNPHVPPAPWSGAGFFRDATRWEGVPTQVAGGQPGYAAGGYGAGVGYGAGGYGAGPGYASATADSAPGYPDAPPAQPSGLTPPPPPYGAMPPAPQPPSEPPAPPTQPPTQPPAPPTQPPA